MMAHETPNDLERARPVQLVAVRRLRDALREADRALGELEAAIAIPSTVPRATVRAAIIYLGDVGDIAHVCRHELTAIFGGFPY
jgi:hypothetical protein